MRGHLYGVWDTYSMRTHRVYAATACTRAHEELAPQCDTYGVSYLSIYLSIYLYTYIVWVVMYVCICVHICMYVCIYIYSATRMGCYIYTYVCVCVCVCIYIYIYIYTYIYIYRSELIQSQTQAKWTLRS